MNFSRIALIIRTCLGVKNVLHLHPPPQSINLTPLQAYSSVVCQCCPTHHVRYRFLRRCARRTGPSQLQSCEYILRSILPQSYHRHHLPSLPLAKSCSRFGGRALCCFPRHPPLDSRTKRRKANNATTPPSLSFLCHDAISGPPCSPRHAQHHPHLASKGNSSSHARMLGPSRRE